MWTTSVKAVSSIAAGTADNYVHMIHKLCVCEVGRLWPICSSRSVDNNSLMIDLSIFYLPACSTLRFRSIRIIVTFYTWSTERMFTW